MVRLSLSKFKISNIVNTPYPSFIITKAYINKKTVKKIRQSNDDVFIEGRFFKSIRMQAINNAASALGLLCSDGIVLAVEKRVQSKLLEKPKTSEKMYKIDNHIACAVAGLTSDANILLNEARLLAQKHRYRYRESQNVESMIKALCNMKQSYTSSGLRPFGVSFLIGWDKHFGFQLSSDPQTRWLERCCDRQ